MWAPQTSEPVAMETEEEEVVDEAVALREKLEDLSGILAAGKVDEAIAGFREVLNFEPVAALTDSVQKVKEESIYKLAKAYANARRFSDVMDLVRSAAGFFQTIPKARTAKIVRTVIDIVSKTPDSLPLQVDLCQQVIAWCRAEKRTFLRQRIQNRLAGLLFEQGKYQDAVNLINRLLRELKKLDDKQLLVETHLVEARVHNALRNAPKSKAALTAARTAGNAIYIAPLMQAELDEMSGTLHCEESDYKTSFSYFLESYEAFDSQGDERALRCLKYMMLCKVLQGAAAEVSALMAGKWGIKHSGEDLDAMVAVAKAARNRSLVEYDAAVAANRSLLDKDLLIRHHLDALYDQLLESNLLKIVEPFSRVDIARVAELIDLPAPAVERKLGQMVLDKKLRGILDQGRGQLILYEETPGDKVYADGLSVMANMGKVMDSLFNRVQNNLAH